MYITRYTQTTDRESGTLDRLQDERQQNKLIISGEYSSSELTDYVLNATRFHDINLRTDRL